MPKPSGGQILNALHAALPTTVLIGEAARAVTLVINDAWAETERELERGREELRFVVRALQHLPGCFAHPDVGCACGLDEALGRLRAVRVGATVAEEPICGEDGLAGAAPSAWEDPPSKPCATSRPSWGIRNPGSTQRTTWAYVSPEAKTTGEGEDWEEYNRLQRARREAYAGALADCGWSDASERSDRAARKHPLKKRSVHPDVVVDGIKLRVNGDRVLLSSALERCALGRNVSRAVLAAALEILDSPYVWTDDTDDTSAEELEES